MLRLNHRLLEGAEELSMDVSLQRIDVGFDRSDYSYSQVVKRSYLTLHDRYMKLLERLHTDKWLHERISRAAAREKTLHGVTQTPLKYAGFVQIL